MNKVTRRFIELGGKIEDGEWIVWKFVKKDMTSPTIRGNGFQYHFGRRVTDRKTPNPNPVISCGAGLNVHAAQPPKRLLMLHRGNMVLLECRVRPQDVVCIPHGARRWGINVDYISGPKFRVKSLVPIAVYEYDPTDRHGLKAIQVHKDYEIV